MERLQSRLREKYVIYNTSYNNVPEVLVSGGKIRVNSMGKTIELPLPPTGIPIAYVGVYDMEFSTYREYRVILVDMFLSLDPNKIREYVGDFGIQILPAFGYPPGKEIAYLNYDKTVANSLEPVLSQIITEKKLDVYDDRHRYDILRFGLQQYFNMVENGIIPRPPDPQWIYHRLVSLVDTIIRKEYGFDKLEVLFLDNNIEDIFINSHDSYAIIHHKRWKKCITSIYMDARSIDKFLEKLKILYKRKTSQHKPFLDYQIPGTFNIRVNANFEPFAVDGGNITMRKNLETPIPLPYLIFSPNMKVMDIETASLLFEMIHRGGSMLFVGPTGSGKTSIMKSLLFLTPKSVRIISLEDTVELPNMGKWGYHMVRLSARSPLTKFSEEEFDLKKAVKVPLRMRPETLVVGEVRDEEARTLFEALQMGSATVYSTAHGRDPEAIIRRFVQFLGVEPSAIADLDFIVNMRTLDIPGFETMRRVIRIVMLSERLPMEEGKRILKVTSGSDTVEIEISDVVEYENEGVVIDSSGGRSLKEGWKVNWNVFLNSRTAREIKLRVGLNKRALAEEIVEKYNVIQLIGEIIKVTNDIDTILKYTSFVVEGYYYLKDIQGESKWELFELLKSAVNNYSRKLVGKELARGIQYNDSPFPGLT